MTCFSYIFWVFAFVVCVTSFDICVLPFKGYYKGHKKWGQTEKRDKPQSKLLLVPSEKVFICSKKDVLLTIPKRLLCRSSSLFVRWLFHMIGPAYDKTYTKTCGPVKIQISLRISFRWSAKIDAQLIWVC